MKENMKFDCDDDRGYCGEILLLVWWVTLKRTTISLKKECFQKSTVIPSWLYWILVFTAATNSRVILDSL